MTRVPRIFLLMSRNFAPAADRLRSVISLERGIPRVMEEARQNVSNPPRVYTEVALQQMPDTIAFFQHDVPEAFREVQDPKLLAEFKASNAAAITALSKYQDFMRKDLLPASHGDFRLGSENFRKKLLYDEMVDIPIDRLLEVGFADLRRNQQQFKEVAAQIDPHRSPARCAGRPAQRSSARGPVAADFPQHPWRLAENSSSSRKS